MAWRMNLFYSRRPNVSVKWSNTPGVLPETSLFSYFKKFHKQRMNFERWTILFFISKLQSYWILIATRSAIRKTPGEGKILSDEAFKLFLISKFVWNWFSFLRVSIAECWATATSAVFFVSQKHEKTDAKGNLIVRNDWLMNYNHKYATAQSISCLPKTNQ